MKDDDGVEVKSGDWISFSYGTPPVGVRAKLSGPDDALIYTVLGRHNPRTGKLRGLRRHVSNWYKVDGIGGDNEMA